MTNAKINEAVSKGADDYLITPEESYKLTFEKRADVNGNVKIARANFDIGHKQFMEIVEKYGLKPAGKWEVWDKEQKRNVRFVEK